MGILTLIIVSGFVRHFLKLDTRNKKRTKSIICHYHLSFIKRLRWRIGPHVEAKLAQLVRWMALNEKFPVRISTQPSEEKCACAVGQGTFPKVVLVNDHLLSLDYEYGNGALKYVKHS